MQNADLTYTNFRNANVTKANFSKADISHAIFSESSVDEAILTGAKTDEAIFKDVTGMETAIYTTEYEDMVLNDYTWEGVHIHNGCYGDSTIILKE